MHIYDFMCKNENCDQKDVRISRAFNSPSMRLKYPPVCDSCKQEMQEVEPVKVERRPGRMVIKGATTVNTNEGFARGLTSKNPEDLKRDMERGDLFN